MVENRKNAELESEIKQLKAELQHQKGMFWIIGEIIKNATNIASFQELMKIVTDMLMGVMGVSACYVWIYNEPGQYTLHFRNIFLGNKYIETNTHYLPPFLENAKGSKPFLDFNIQKPFVFNTPLPGSRLAAPLYDFQSNSLIGFLIVEHETTHFFKTTTSSLFQTLAIFIGSNSFNSKLFETVTMETEKDPLTKVFNRKFLSRFLAEYDSSKSLTLCIFDIDSFKLVNDLHGHEKGDDVLVAIAEVANRIIAPYGGKVIRYGGDEFILLLELPLQKCISILNDLRILIPTLPVMDELSSPITITMGVSEYPSSTTNLNVLVAMADSALLRGKALGKNVLEVG